MQKDSWMKRTQTGKYPERSFSRMTMKMKIKTGLPLLPKKRDNTSKKKLNNQNQVFSLNTPGVCICSRPFGI